MTFFQNLKDALVAKLGGTTASDFASVDHLRQIAEARTAEPISHVEVVDSGYSEATENPTPLPPRIEDTPEYQRAKDMHDEIMRSYTLENTPTAYIDDRYDYGTEEGDAPIVEDAGIEEQERKLDEYLEAHPELYQTRLFRSYVSEQTQEAGLEQ